jgi:hypothetical protein
MTSVDGAKSSSADLCAENAEGDQLIAEERTSGPKAGGDDKSVRKLDRDVHLAHVLALASSDHTPSRFTPSSFSFLALSGAHP